MNRSILPEPIAALNREEQIKAEIEDTYNLVLQMYYVNKPREKKAPKLPKDDFRRHGGTVVNSEKDNGIKIPFLSALSIRKKVLQRSLIAG